MLLDDFPLLEDQQWTPGIGKSKTRKTAACASWLKHERLFSTFVFVVR